MQPSHKSKHLSHVKERFIIYSLLKEYYQGDIAKGQLVIGSVERYLHQVGTAGAVSESDEGSCPSLGERVDDQTVFDYNRLFIGPGALLAPPFESAYRNDQRMVMQRETLEVRKWYKQAGIEVLHENVIPDDHVALELEFVCFLLSQMGQALADADEIRAKHYVELYQGFFDNHIRMWIYRHCEDVFANGKTMVCRGIARALVNFMRSEEAGFLAEEGAS